MGEVIKAYKGFDKDLRCRGMQYEVGNTYQMPEEDVKVCERGYHACERPLDVFDYYPPADSRFCVVEQSGELQRRGDDTKVASSSIRIGAEIGIPGLVKAQIEYVKAHTTMGHTDPERATAGDRGAATAGEYGAATAGYRGAATAGDCGAATAGDRGAATAGYRGAATAGEYGAATAGYCGAATAGEYGAATAGYRGAATSRGSSAAGKEGLAVARGCEVKVKGGLGAVLVICEEAHDSYAIKEWVAAVVDGEDIKADTWYRLRNGKLEEVKE